MEVATNIIKESQEVTRIATVAAEACTDSRMRMVGGANDIVDWALQRMQVLLEKGANISLNIKAVCSYYGIPP